MTYYIVDLMNFIDKVRLVKHNEIVEDAYDYINRAGNIKVKYEDVIYLGTHKTLVIKES